MPAPAIRHPAPRRILIIKLGALGDVVQSFGPMKAIRAHHPAAHITVMTTTPFAAMIRASGYADDILTDTRPRATDIRGWMALRRALTGGGFERVYDLQNNDRTALYLRLFPDAVRPDWVGAAPGATIRNTSAGRTAGHAFDGHVQTLALAGVTPVPPDDLSWMQGAAPTSYGLAPPFMLLVPGASPRHPEKRWPATHYAALAAHAAAHGITPVIIGGDAETALAAIIREAAPAALDLCGRTAITDIPALARAAMAAVGNDTGPMHLIAATGCPCVVLFSAYSDPVRHAPRGPRVRVRQARELDSLPEADIIAILNEMTEGQIAL